MRDPNRIKPFTDEISQIWKEKCPDWRFGQFMINILPYLQNQVGDVWFIEDDEMLELIKTYFTEENN